MALEELPFQRIRESALKRIRLSEAPAAAIRQQAINAAGLRTSGVGQLPLIQAARNRALQESGLEESISGQEAQQIGQERLAEQAFKNQMALLERQYALQDLAGKTASRRGFQGMLAGAGVGAGLGALNTALLSRFPGLAAAGRASSSPRRPLDLPDYGG